MRFDIITLFPEMFFSLTNYGITGHAFSKGYCKINTWNLRSFTTDKHKSVDDKPYGGGNGMVMLIHPFKMAISQIKKDHKKHGIFSSHIIMMTPQGKTLNHDKIIQLSKKNSIIFLCGRYEGVDQRLIDNYVDEEISIGDFILSGGEIPAMTVIDSIIRLLPNVLNKKKNNLKESFEDNLLSFPHYTRPREYRGNKVPNILLSGNHSKIEIWRRMESLKKTWKNRPDLIIKARKEKKLNSKDELFLLSIINNLY